MYRCRVNDHCLGARLSDVVIVIQATVALLLLLTGTLK